MAHTREHRNGDAAFSCCGPMMMHPPRYCGMGFGIMLILVGTIWLAAKMGWIVPELFWPAAVLAAGVAVLVLTLSRGTRSRINDRQNKEV